MCKMKKICGVKETNDLEGKIIVHITGEVKNTGILVLKEEARIADAIESAGGATEEADLNKINLAYTLKDGQKIYIPNKEDEENIAYITEGSGNNVSVENGDESEMKEKIKININTASQAELEELPGIGEAIASRIIEYREENGTFNKIEDLLNVKGIGDAKFAEIKEYVVVN